MSIIGLIKGDTRILDPLNLNLWTSSYDKWQTLEEISRTCEMYKKHEEPATAKGSFLGLGWGLGFRV